VADKNGYFYYIGTQSNTMPWKNPHENRFIDVTYEPYNASIGYNNPADIVGVKPGQWGSGHDSYDTDDVRHFIIVDLLNNPPLCPDHYTIAHTWEGWSGRLKNWNLEASNDKIKWDTLREHKEDTSLTKTNAFRGVLNECGWPIVGCSTYYRYFRILGTGPNSDGSQHIGKRIFKLIIFSDWKIGIVWNN
jgi:hypothetical protein